MFIKSWSLTRLFKLFRIIILLIKVTIAKAKPTINAIIEIKSTTWFWNKVAISKKIPTNEVNIK